MIWAEFVTTLAEEARAPSAGKDIFGIISWFVGVLASLVAMISTIQTLRAKKNERRVAENDRTESELPPERLQEARLSSKAVHTVEERISEPGGGMAIVVRFVFFYLALAVLDLLTALLQTPEIAAWTQLQKALDSGRSVWTILGAFAIGLVSALPVLLAALVLVTVGWPLLLDAARFVSIPLPSFLEKKQTKWLILLIAILTALGHSFFLTVQFVSITSPP